MDEKAMVIIAGFIQRALEAVGNREALERIRFEVAEFCSEFPLHQSATKREAA
jgi:glycine/serine hydroxymethyltransferase